MSLADKQSSLNLGDEYSAPEKGNKNTWEAVSGSYARSVNGESPKDVGMPVAPRTIEEMKVMKATENQEEIIHTTKGSEKVQIVHPTIPPAASVEDVPDPMGDTAPLPPKNI